MQHLKSYLDEHFGKRLILAIVGAFLFTYLGKSIFDTYYRYFDHRQYIKIEQPVSINKKSFKPCEVIVLTTKITSLIDVNVDSLTQLVLVRVDGATERVGNPLQGSVPIRAMEEHIISGSLSLPCVLSDGTYYYQGNATYLVHGYPHDFSFITDTFNVYESGLSPQTEQNINDAVHEESTKSGNIVQ